VKSVKVDATELQTSINKLENMINSFEEIELTLFSKVISLKDIWNDGYSVSFYEAMENEKHEFDVLAEDLKRFKDTYDYIYNIVSKYGNKLQADFTAAHNIATRHNSCNQKFYTIESQYDNLDLRRCSEVSNEIHNQKSKFRTTRKELDRYMDRFNDAIEDLNTMEYDVKSRILDLDLDDIESITFSEEAFASGILDSNSVGITFTDNLDEALRNIKVSIQDEEEIIADINNEFVVLRNHYISNINSKIVNNKQVDFNCQFKTLKNNHDNMIVFINSLKEKYLQLNNDIVSNIDKDIKKVV